MTKDVELALAEAARCGAPMPVSEAVARRWHSARDLLGGDIDLTRIAQVIAAEAGVRLSPD